MSAESDPNTGTVSRLDPRRGAVVVPSARNSAILHAVRAVLNAALNFTVTEEATQQVEAAIPAPPDGSYLTKLRWRLRWRVGVLFLAVDLVASFAAYLIVPTGLAAASFLIVAAAIVITCNRTDLHRSRLELSVLDDLPALLLVSIIGGGAVAALGAIEHESGSRLQPSLLFGAVAFGLLTISRAAAYALTRLLRRTRLVSHPVLIVGAGEIGQQLAEAMLEHPENGLRPVGFVDAEWRDRPASILPIFGGIDALPRALTEFGINDIVFAFGSHPDAAMVRVVRACVCMDRQVFVVPRYFELYGADRRARVEVIWGLPLVRLRRWPMRPGQYWTKRGMDVGLAGLGLALLWPVMAMCALAVRLELGRGIVFRQVRVGRSGQTFVLLKFRTLPLGRAEGDIRWSAEGDMTVGPVGRFLRRTGLDELPQLINVLRGEMSLVGPRPERPHFVRAFGERVLRYGDRHRVRQGLTGWAQINGLRGDTSIRDRVTFDNYYIDNWSLWSDVKIMIRTLATLIGRRRLEPGTVEQLNEFGRAASIQLSTR